MDSKTHELGVVEKDSPGRGAVIASQELGNGIMNRDEEEMAYYGKRQQLKRNFGFLSIAGFVCSLLATWEGMFSVFLYGFQNGGPAGLVYGYIFCWIGTLAVVASMAELASMMPLAGGQYHWVAILAPPKWAKFLSYITGWVTFIAWQAAQSSVAFLSATIIQGLAILNYDTYIPKRWHGTLILYAVMVIIIFTNTYLARWLPKIEGLVLCLHVIGFFGIIIPLVYLSPHGSAHDVFATFINGGGWSSNGLSFFVGIVTSVFSFLGADGACHMSEEIYNASTVVPWAMITSVTLNGILGFAALIAILFCLGNIDDALASPTGYPFIEIFAQGVNSKAGATGMVAVLLVLLITATVGMMATASRLLWSFARDGGVPGWKYISRVHASTALPLYSIFVTCTIPLLLALINIGSTTALNAVVSVNCAAFFSSYMIPIALIFLKRLRNNPEKDHIRWGPWKMGPVFGPTVNAIALIYAILAFFFSFFPATSTVTPVTMNWSCLIFGASIIFSVLFYLLFGKRSYKWPVVDPIRRRH